jgi:hypothetical protein
MSLSSLFSLVDVGGDFGRPIGALEDVIVRIAVQTIECGIFIQQYMTDPGERLGILSGDISVLTIDR